ncbi:CIC11C00000000081 [Sungouiella intermedia]|uniref:CIC11C00000000081 n=1 Tax=Sungouiella intermedia TaxID=45354 RepID=A0A1L0BV35_9ASCO|nr:CIC11C00000000081 [[Candida] intermedia]
MLVEKSGIATEIESLGSSEADKYVSTGNKNLDYLHNFDHEAHPEEVTMKQITRKLDIMLVFPMLFVYFCNSSIRFR